MTYGQGLTGAALLGPQGQKSLKNAHQRGIDADENGRPYGEGGHGIVGIAAGHDGVGGAKGHDGQLPGQHGARMPSYVLQFALHGALGPVYLSSTRTSFWPARRVMRLTSLQPWRSLRL